MEAACFSSDRLSRRSLAYHISSPTADLSIAHEIGDWTPAAYSLRLTHAARPSDRLYSLAVSPNHRGQGLATQLLQHCEAQSSAPSLYLEVRADNDLAIGLYNRLGFLKAKRKSAYYQDGMDALVMMKTL